MVSNQQIREAISKTIDRYKHLDKDSEGVLGLDTCSFCKLFHPAYTMTDSSNECNGCPVNFVHEFAGCTTNPTYKLMDSEVDCQRLRPDFNPEPFKTRVKELELLLTQYPEDHD